MKQGDKHISGDSNDIHIGEATATYSVGGQTHTIHTKPSSFDVIKGDDTTATATATTDDDTDTSDAKTQSVEDRIAFLKAKLAGSVRSGSYASSGSSSAVAVSVMLI